jgi:hypothetical protein
LNFYHANGRPAGFTALHQSSGETHQFDEFGYRLH